MTIGDIKSQDPSDQSQGYSPSDTTPPAQGLDQDEHEGEDDHHDQDQEESNNQGVDEDDGDKEESNSRARLSHPIVQHNV
jgi:hypothetical protein